MRKSVLVFGFLVVSAIILFGCSPQEGGNIIKITGSGFEPNTLTVSQGDIVTWMNNDTQPHWIASNPHPSHDAYPEKGGCIGSKFDSCGSLGQGENFSFTFNYPGTWGFHDHLRPASYRGTVVVK